MVQKTLYLPKRNSPLTELALGIGAADTVINVVDETVFPAAPNLATIGVGNDAETILYTAKNIGQLSGITRGFDGDAKAWDAGEIIGRVFTGYDWAAMVDNWMTAWHQDNVEQGSSANGSYIRFPNGLQICWKYDLSLTYSTTSKLEGAWTFPAQFIDANYAAVATLHGSGLSAAKNGGSALRTPTKLVNSMAINMDSNALFVSGDSVVVQAIAFGRWM